MNKKSYSLRKQQAKSGRIFAIPFYLGFLFFFLKPMFQSIMFVFQRVTMQEFGYKRVFVGLSNLKYIFTEDTYYTTNLVSSVVKMLWQVPVILVLSLFFALILNQKFHGRTFVRAVFFLPVILASGIILELINSDVAANQIMSGNAVAGGEITQSDALATLLTDLGLSSKVINFATNISDNLFNLAWLTGIQTVIFLAAVQSISGSLYEAAMVEGASSWEIFWKITLPMISPMILTNFIYSVVDCFTLNTNAVMKQVLNTAAQLKYGWSAAMAWVYFLIIFAVILIVIKIFSALEADKPKGKKRYEKT